MSDDKFFIPPSKGSGKAGAPGKKDLAQRPRKRKHRGGSQWFLGPGAVRNTTRRIPTETFGDSEAYDELDYSPVQCLDCDSGSLYAEQREAWNFNNIMSAQLWMQPKGTWTVALGQTTVYFCGSRTSGLGSYSGINIGIIRDNDPHLLVALTVNAAGTQVICYANAPAPFVTGTWYHISFVAADGVTATANQFYLNGSPITTTNPTGDMTDRNAQGFPHWFVGSRYGAPYAGNDAYLSTVRTWIKPLTASEVADNYNKVVAPGTYGLNSQHILDNSIYDTCYHNSSPLTQQGGTPAFVNVPTVLSMKRQVYRKRKLGGVGISAVSMTFDPDDYADGDYASFNAIDSRFMPMPSAYEDGNGSINLAHGGGSPANPKQLAVRPSTVSDSVWRQIYCMPNPDHPDYPFGDPCYGGWNVQMEIYDQSDSETYWYLRLGVRSAHLSAGQYEMRVKDEYHSTYRPYNSGGGVETLYNADPGLHNNWENIQAEIDGTIGGYNSAGIDGNLNFYAWVGDFDTRPAAISSIDMSAHASCNKWPMAIGPADRFAGFDSDADNEWPWENNYYRRFPASIYMQSRNNKICYVRKIKFTRYAYTPAAP